jgi:putative endopeptidase
MLLRSALLLFICIINASSLRAGAVDSLHEDWIDKDVAPQQNFYLYANGNWMKKNPIPPEYSSWGTFNTLHIKVQKLIHTMLINAMNDASAAKGSDAKKIADFYYSGMDETSINRLGINPLQAEFDRIKNINSLKDLQNTMMHLQSFGVDAGFNFGSMQDFTNSDEMIGAAMQGGLSLPDRDYYLKDEPKFIEIRKTYLDHLKKMFELLGYSSTKATTTANSIMKIEVELAKASMSKIAQRDPHAIYNIKTLAELNHLTPNFSWNNYFNGMGLSTLKRINVGMPDFFKSLNGLLKTVSLDDWKAYLTWHLLDSFAPYLSKPFVDQNFLMVSAITGTKKLLPRWQRVINTENEALGFAIGKLYVSNYFPPSSKQDVLTILSNIRKALKDDLETLSWMTPATRAAALKKLSLMKERVGYPDKWWDYSALTIDRGPYVLNVKRANEFLIRRDLNKIDKPIDKTEWAMTPQTVNAYYDPSMNNINMPAGILQSPFFDPKAPAAINYGGIGFVIGHEITHGFDDQGAQFDGHGNLNNWWTTEDLKKFQAATHCIVDQFSKYKLPDNLSIQGKLVVGEASADLGGVMLAYRAFHASKAYKYAKTTHGVTPDQQFFLSVAHIWASNLRPEYLRHMVTVDPHPPAEFRVNGTLVNMSEFKSAFHLPKNCPMVHEPRCVIW